MASSILHRKFSTSATASTFLNQFLRHKLLSPAISSPLPARSFATTPNKDTKENNKQNRAGYDPPLVIKGPPEELKYEHPFQISGPKDVVEVDGTKDGTLVRVALPGVGEDGFRVWVEQDTIFFQGKANSEHERDEPRTYGGSLQFNAEFNKPKEFKAEMKNGILRLLVPNADGVAV